MQLATGTGMVVVRGGGGGGVALSLSRKNSKAKTFLEFLVYKTLDNNTFPRSMYHFLNNINIASI